MAYIGQPPFQEFTNPPTKDSFTGDGSTTTFDLAAEVPSSAENALEVYVNNVRQEPGTGKAFTLGVDGSGDLKRITFTAAPASGAPIYVINDKTNTSVTAPLDFDTNGTELILDGDGDTSLHASTDDQIDIKIAGADDFTFTANTFTALSGSTIAAQALTATTIGASGVVTANAGVVVDNITIDGTEIDLSSGDLTIDVAGDIVLDADGGDVFVKDAGTTFGSLTNTSGNLIIKSGTTTAATFSGANVTFAGTVGSGAITSTGIVTGTAFTAGSAVLAEAELELLDGLTAGTAIASKVVTTDANIDTTGQRNLTISGELDAATLDISGDADIDGTTNLDAVDIDGAVQLDATLTVGANDQGYDVILYGDTASANVTWDTSADDLIFNGAAGLIVPDGQLTLGSTAVTATAAEINLIDGGTSRGTTAIADGDGIIHNDGGTMKVTTAATFKTYFQEGLSSNTPSSADGQALGSASLEWSDLFLADGGTVQFGNDQEIRLIHTADTGLILKHTATADDKPVSLTLQTGETDMAANDVIGKIDFQAPDEGTGTDAILVAAGIEAIAEGDFSSSNNATKLSFKTAASEAAAEKMSLSSAGLLTVADDIVFKDGGTIGVSSAVDAMTVSSGGIVTFKDDILIKDGGTIGSASDADAMSIAAGGAVTFTQTPVFPDGSLPLADLDIDGGTDIGAALADADLFIVDDGAGGTNRKLAASRIKTYVGAAVLTQVATSNVTSAAGAITFASCFTSTYRNYFVVFDNIKVATNGADINMLFHYGDSNGNDSTNHNYQNIMRYPGTTDTAGEGNGNDIKFVQAQKAAAGCFVHGVMYVFQPLNTTDGVTAGIIHSNSNTNNSVGAQMTVTSFNMPEAGTNSAYTGFQFAASSGNIEGRITVYGITDPA